MIFDKNETVYLFFDRDYVVTEGFITSQQQANTEDKDFYLRINGLPPFYIWDMASTNENMIHIKQYSEDGSLKVLDVYVFKDKDKCIEEANKMAEETISYLKRVVYANTERLTNK